MQTELRYIYAYTIVIRHENHHMIFHRYSFCYIEEYGRSVNIVYSPSVFSHPLAECLSRMSTTISICRVSLRCFEKVLLNLTRSVVRFWSSAVNQSDQYFTQLKAIIQGIVDELMDTS